MPWLLGSLFSIAVIYAGICLFFYVFQERFIFLRFRTARHHRYRFPRCKELWVERDGAHLHALHFSCDRPKGVVLYFHGHSGSLKRWGKKAARFTQLGYEVLMPDPRGYGKSRGPISEAALITDAVAWFDQVRVLAEGRPVVVYGRSLGCALAVPLAAQRQPAKLLLETPFADMAEVMWSHLPFLPYRWLLRYPFRNDVSIREVHCPVYIFHGRRDLVVPYASALRLYAAVPGHVQRELLTFPKGHHSDLYKFEEFRQAVRKLLV